MFDVARLFVVTFYRRPMDGKCVSLRCKLYYTSYSYALVINIGTVQVYVTRYVNELARGNGGGGREEFDIESGSRLLDDFENNNPPRRSKIAIFASGTNAIIVTHDGRVGCRARSR